MKRPDINLTCTTDNHYKYYDLIDNDDGTFTARYGKIGKTEVTHQYPMHKWNTILRQKLNECKL